MTNKIKEQHVSAASKTMASMNEDDANSYIDNKFQAQSYLDKTMKGFENDESIPKELVDQTFFILIYLFVILDKAGQKIPTITEQMFDETFLNLANYHDNEQSLKDEEELKEPHLLIAFMGLLKDQDTGGFNEIAISPMGKFLYCFVSIITTHLHISKSKNKRKRDRKK